MIKLLIFSMFFIAVVVGLSQLIPYLLDLVSAQMARGVAQQQTKFKDAFVDMKPKRLLMLNTMAPLLGAVIGFAASQNIIGALVGLGIGFVIPAIVVKNIVFQRKAKFHAQITDGLMILSSCLKGGLSLLQSIEVLVEELPPPISQEFGLILRENKMGIALEESFESLNKRMPSDELNLMTTAILVARETGGDITLLFGRLISTIRAKVKINDSVATLSMQGKMQGVIMSALPVVFAVMVVSFDKNYFDVMLSSELGRSLLIYAAVSEIIGIFLIRIFSKVNV